MMKHDDLNVPSMAVAGVASLLLLVGTVLGVQALFGRYEWREQQAKVVEVSAFDLDNLLIEQEAKLRRIGWLDKSQGRVAIPVERAMKIVLEEALKEQEGGP